MNRLIIIGNGFDLAHDLKTNYSDFLEYYWSNIKDGHDDGLVKFNTKYAWKECYNMDDFKYNAKNSNKYSNNIVNFELNNSFFERLNTGEISESNWVDIERLYYKELNSYWPNQKNEINKLNKEFNTVKKVFEKYILHAVENCEYKEDLHYPEMDDVFENYVINSNNNFRNYKEDLLEKMPHKINKAMKFNASNRIIDNKVHVLVFNYTHTIKHYKHLLKQYSSYQINYIHGIAGSTDNEIVFGYGDEKDKLFSELKDSNENAYVEHLKSTAYLKTISHFYLMDFIDSGEFIVEVVGHSCGLSDRTLLKSIFENDNCQQIFLHYYQKEEDGVKVDNFHDLSINISRHFDDQIKMRKRVANKEFCTALPQRKDSIKFKED